MTKEAMEMKKRIITLAIAAALAATNISAYSAEIPRESTTSVHLPKANVSLSAARPSCRHALNATEHQIQITENLIGDILDEVESGNLGYTLAAGYANTRIRKAVMANQTDGNGYGVLSPIAQNAIRIMRDKQLRPDAYVQAEEELKVLLADVITEVHNGMNIDAAIKAAYEKIYQSINPSFNYGEQFSLDTCYRDIPVVGMEMFTVARKLINNAFNK